MRALLRALPALALCLLAACASHRARKDDQALNFPEPPAPPADGAIFHTGYSGGLFENPTARNVGDVVTVVLMETTTAAKSSQTDTSKATKDSLAAPTILGMPVTIHGTAVLSGSLNNANSFSGAGDSKQSDSLVGDISVTVIRRLANGNLVIRGQKEIDLNQGSEYIRLQGVIRPVDISPDNTIPSTQVADARIAYGQHGALNDANAPGLLSRFFNLSWLPF
ncbi:MAG TPA: flagellar basal body L-ring protein FlgH [Steroidobacteraceae bacterium]|nr:flagellar basal body L-ring protein FlgH [Steroidobacteraceae bacterium]